MPVQIVLSVKDDGTATLNQVAGKIKDFETKAVGMAGSVGAAWDKLKANWLEVAAVGLTAMKAFDFAAQAAQTDETIGRLNRQLAGTGQTAAEVVPQLQAVVAGQLSIANASELMSRGLAAGFNVEQIKSFATLAKGISSQMGGTIESAFEQLTTAVSTGMFRSLKSMQAFAPAVDEVQTKTQALADATGRTVDEITELEKRQIALTTVMAHAAEIQDSLGGSTESLNDKFSAFKAQLADVKLALGQGLIAAGQGAFAVTQLVASGLTVLFARFVQLSSAMGWVSDKLGLTTGQFAEMQQAGRDLEGAAAKLAGESLANLSLAAEQATRALNPLASSTKAAAAATAAHAAALGPATVGLQLQKTLLEGVTQAMQAQQQLRQQAVAGLKELTASEFADKLGQQATLEDKIAQIRRASANLPSGRQDRAEELKRLTDLAAGLRSDAAQAGQTVEASQQKLVELEQQRTQALRTSVGSLEQLGAAAAKASELDDAIAAQKTLIEGLASGTASATGEVDRLVKILRDDLRSTFESNKTAAEDSLGKLSKLVADNKLGVTELDDTVKLLQTTLTKEMRLEIKGLDDAIAKAKTLTATLAGTTPAPPPSGDTSFGTPDTAFGTQDFSFAAPGDLLAPMPAFASGTDFVPRDMLALVHRGEKITPAAENRPGARGGDTYQYNLYFSGVTDRQFVRDVIVPELRALQRARGEF